MFMYAAAAVRGYWWYITRLRWVVRVVHAHGELHMPLSLRLSLRLCIVHHSFLESGEHGDVVEGELAGQFHRRMHLQNFFKCAILQAAVPAV